MCNLKKIDTDYLIYKAERETQMYRANMWTPEGKGEAERTGRLGLTHTHD